MAEKNRIRHEVAATFFAIFDVSPPRQSSDYEIEEFKSILAGSRFIFPVDCRTNPSAELARLATVLQQFGIMFKFEFDVSTNTALIACNEAFGIRVYDSPNHPLSFADFLSLVEILLPEHIECRRLHLRNWVGQQQFAILPSQAWMEMSGEAAELRDSLFQSQGRWIPLRKLWCEIPILIAIVLLVFHFLALKWISTALIGPNNIFGDFGRTAFVLLGLFCYIEIEFLTRAIFHYDDGHRWYDSKLLNGAFLLIFLFAFGLESFERNDRLSAEKLELESRKFHQEFREKMNDPNVQAGFKKMEEIRKRREAKEREKAPSETEPTD